MQSGQSFTYMLGYCQKDEGQVGLQFAVPACAEPPQVLQSDNLLGAVDTLQKEGSQRECRGASGWEAIL